MSSEVKKPSPFFFYISDNYNQYSKIRWGDYEGMKSKNIFELLKKKPKFHSNTSLCSIIYKTPTFTLPLPDDLVPLDVFPELRYKLEIKPKVFDEAPVEEKPPQPVPPDNQTNGDGSTQENPAENPNITQEKNEKTVDETIELNKKYILKLVDDKSEFNQSVTIKFRHISDLYDPVTVRIPSSAKSQSSDLYQYILEQIGEQTWEKQLGFMASSLNVNPVSLILLYKEDGVDYHLFHFTKIKEIIPRLFNNGVFKPHGEFVYDINLIQNPIKMPGSSEQEIFEEFGANLFEQLKTRKPSGFIDIILDNVRKFYYANEVLLNKEMLDSLKLSISKVAAFRIVEYLSIYFNFDKTVQYDWSELQGIPGENRLKPSKMKQEPDPELLYVLCLAKWSTFPNDVVDRFCLAQKTFNRKGFKNTDVYFGNVIYFHSVSFQTVNYPIFLSRGFVSLLNFSVKEKVHEIFTESYKIPINIGLTNLLVFGAPIQCVKFMQFEPGKSTGILFTPRGSFLLDFSTVEALTDFWILLSIAQNELKMPYIKPTLPDVKIEFTFPTTFNGEYANANVEVANEKWSISISIQKLFKKISKIYSRNKVYKVMVTHDSPLVDLKYPKDDNIINYLNLNYSRNKLTEYFSDTSLDNYEKLLRFYLYSTCVELSCTENRNHQIKFLKIFGISDFSRAIVTKSLPLLQYQLKNFGTISTGGIDVKKTPLLNFAALFSDDLKFLQVIIDSLGINAKDRDEKSSLFYSIRNSQQATQMLVENGVNIGISDKQSITPIIESMNIGAPEQSILLSSYKTNNTVVNMSLQNELLYTLKNKSFDYFEKILPYCPITMLNSPTCDGEYLTHILIREKFIDQLYLISSNCPEFNPNRFTDKFPHPLHYFFDISSPNDLELFSALLSIPKLDLNIRNSKGETPLSRAIKIQSVSLLEKLVADPRCDLEIQDENKHTYLYSAVELRNKDMILALLKAGTLVNAPNGDEERNTPLFIAVKNDDITNVELLINYGANHNKWYNNEGYLPQHVGNPEIIQRLRDKSFTTVYPKRTID